MAMQNNNQYINPTRINTNVQFTTDKNDFCCISGEKCKEKTYLEATLKALFSTFNRKKRTGRSDFSKASKIYSFVLTPILILSLLGLKLSVRIDWVLKHPEFIVVAVVIIFVLCCVLIYSYNSLVKRRLNDLDSPYRFNYMGIFTSNEYWALYTVLNEKDGVPYETIHGINPVYKNVKGYYYKDII